MSHALVVGGTGMLRGVPLYLAGRGDTVSVVARGLGGLKSLERAAAALPGRVVPVQVDYRDSQALRAALEAAVAAHGPVRLAVTWIHSDAPATPGVVAGVLEAGSVDCRVFDVHSSAFADPLRAAQAYSSPYRGRAGLHVRDVVLGFVFEGGRSRWLTHREISDGVTAAIERDFPWSTVGVVEPWSARP